MLCLAVLTGSIDDGDTAYEYVTGHVIVCPYSSGCINQSENNAYGTPEYKQACIKCKMAWLNKEYSTKPELVDE